MHLRLLGYCLWVIVAVAALVTWRSGASVAVVASMLVPLVCVAGYVLVRRVASRRYDTSRY